MLKLKNSIKFAYSWEEKVKNRLNIFNKKYHDRI